MNGILGMAQALKADELPGASRDKVSIILDSGSSLMAVLNDVLDFSKIEASKFDICPAPHDIVNTSDRVVRLFETHARDKDVALGFSHADDLPRTLVYDA
jgi:signal transduction histidine kinase